VIKTRNPGDAPALIKQLNEGFQKDGAAVVAGDWQKAAGPYGQSVDVIRIVFTIAIAILSIVAIIIIMNTFIISVIERTGEIGTMRAIGAGKGFIRKLFAAEAMVLSLIFSTLGAVLGLVLVAILRSLKLEAGNPFLQVLFGGKYLSPFVTPLNFFAAVVAMVAVGYIAHLYPVSVALKIQPVRAMQQE
jgi:putative ABC transport system permease protein